MAANDIATRRVTTGIVLAVGLFAGSDSYFHIYTLARDHGQAVASAALLPLAGDGLIAAASSTMLVASRQGRDVPVLARVMLLAGIGATIAANVGYGLHAGLTGALLSVWPVAAYVGCMELLTSMRSNTGMHPQASSAVPGSGHDVRGGHGGDAQQLHSLGCSGHPRPALLAQQHQRCADDQPAQAHRHQQGSQPVHAVAFGQRRTAGEMCLDLLGLA